MPAKTMMVDAIHPEETRVVVTKGNRLEEFDFESATRRQLRGNIYLAKVTRVEPSLQAAFVDYGGNRHGFLAFSEIHPDYYQIPLADREALLRDQAEDNAKAAAEDEIVAHGIAGEAQEFEDDPGPDDQQTYEVHDAAEDNGGNGGAGGGANGKSGEVALAAEASPTVTGRSRSRRGRKPRQVEELGAEDGLDDMARRAQRRNRTYKIQEVIKRRQVLLVQVVKEERGNKGAALTTYLSLAGRYSVLMPNTARGGGISRKITSATDRNRLKDIATGLDVPQDMGVILRTAGAARTKAEVKRDFEYLLRLWENVRELTLASTAPTLVYEEGSLIKRSIRDLYDKDITEVIVAGEEAYKEAKEFMKMIMPSHARHVKLYKDDQPIFSRHGVEAQLDAMFSPRVTLPSGGYIVINPTEALVSIDVNSGKSTREHNIEDTALQTNLEAATEVARQLRLRDLAGLIVIDFIDMEERPNNRTVERKLKDALKTDRARIQIGRISHFGLLEMSRQRIRFGVLESSTRVCPHCEGTGLIRSVESLSLAAMRAVEDQVRRRPGHSVAVHVPADVALYVLNAKRGILADLEQRYELRISVVADASLGASQYTIERQQAGPEEAPTHVRVDSALMDEPPAETEPQPARRRRRRRSGQADEAAETAEASPAAAERPEEEDAGEEGARKRRRRGRRGGRRHRRTEGQPETAAMSDQEQPAETAEAAEAAEAGEPARAAPDDDGQAAEDKKPRRRRRRRTGDKAKDEPAAQSTQAAPEPADEAPAETGNGGTEPAAEPPADQSEPRQRDRKAPEHDEIVVTSTSTEGEKPKRAGWWSR